MLEDWEKNHENINMSLNEVTGQVIESNKY